MSPEKLPNTNNQEPEQINFSQVRTFFSSFVSDLIDLRKGVDKLGTIEEIKNKRSMSGANAWMLMCSIMIASLGLDNNSPAVIIGAMLISPLMSPILGMGLGVGINDLRVVKNSFLHFSVAIMIAILVSTIYFALTPLGNFTPEIEARTHPTILDVLIAFFGGIAGIISMARKDISTTIPGVAIATALMPPLCVTGYGIANLDLNIVLSSFYLFFSNTFFISLSTYLIVRLLKFPFRKYPVKKDMTRNRIVVMFFSLIVTIPSFFILKKLIYEIQTKQKIEAFLTSEFGTQKKYLEDYITIESDSINELFLKVYGNSDKKKFKTSYEKKLDSLGLKDWRVTILPTSELNLERISSIESQIDEVDKIYNLIDSVENIKSVYDANLLAFQLKNNKSSSDSTFIKNVYIKTKEKFPELDEIAIGKLPFKDFETKSEIDKDILIIKWNSNLNANNYSNLEEKLSLYIEGWLNKDSIILIRQ